MMGRGVYAKLDDAKRAEAGTAAQARFDYARRVNRTPRPGHSLDEERLGTRCERAAAVFFPWLTWHAFKTGPVDDTPDLGDMIDVKGVHFDHHELLVPMPKLRAGWAYVLVSAEHDPFYWLAGWQFGGYLLNHASIKHSRPAYALPAAELRPIWQLQRIVAPMRIAA